MPPKVLIVEDNTEITELVSLHLTENGFSVETESNGDDGLRHAKDVPFDLIILDIMLPGMNGLEICKSLRGGDITTQILMLTAKSTEIDRVVGLEIGADDYLTKPFSIQELVARVRAILRRVELSEKKQENAEPEIVIGNLVIDTGRRLVVIDGKEIDLTAREFDLLMYFANHPGRVYTRQQLLDGVWGYGHDGYEHTVNTHINRLRGKIERDPAQPEHILTVWGVGYKLGMEGGKT